MIYHIVSSIVPYHRPSIDPAHRKTAEYKSLECIALELFKLDQDKIYYQQTNPTQSSARKFASNSKKATETIDRLYKEAITPAQSKLLKKLSLRSKKSS